MSTTYTPNFHLGKQEDTSDTFDMSVITDNMDIIDTQMKSNENNISSSQQKIHNIGMNDMSVLLLGNFAVGGLNVDGSLKPEQTNSVSSTDIIKFETDTVLIIQEGFRCGYIPFIGNTAGAWSDWKTGIFTILAGTALKFQIARVNEQSETAPIVEFTNAIKIGFIDNDNDFGRINYYKGSIGTDGKDSEGYNIRLRTNYIDVSKVRSIAISINSRYMYGIHTYNNEFEPIYNSSSWVRGNTTFDVSNASYIRFNFGKEDGQYISPSDAPDMQFVVLDVNDFSEGEYAPYDGNINLGRKYSVKKYLDGYTPQAALPSTIQQGMSIYNGYAFLLYDKGGLAIYDLLHKTAVAEITLASASANNHVNSVNFSTEFVSGGVYPLLYISECYGQHRCFVENITNSGSTLVQTISFTNTNGDYTNSTYNNAFDWILDNDTGLLMTYGVMSDGKHKIKTFAKPSTASATVELTEADVIDQWIIEDYIYPISSTNWIYQGNCAKDGTIYIPTYRPNSIICINETTHEVTARVATTFDNGEPEDVAIWADNLFAVYLGSKIYALSFK